ncbi:MAG: nitrite reductase, partial [Gammaproteobacteria bacterium]|nr:nitrite reductase [Gammaproteobacteria bacterium]
MLAMSVFVTQHVFAKAEQEAETRYQGAASGIDPTTVKEMIDTEGPPMTVDEFNIAKQVYFERCAGC